MAQYDPTLFPRLRSGYDCVDRIVVNLGQSGGGFRTWWRRLSGGDEQIKSDFGYCFPVY